MWQPKMFAFSIYYVLIVQAQGGNGIGSSITSGLEQRNNEPEPLQMKLNAWQPLAGHNNWVILQATAATSMQQQQQQQHHQQQQREQHQYQHQQQHQQQQHEQILRQQHRLPVNYYAYNQHYNPGDENVGNYKQEKPNLSDSPSYVLAIRQQLPPLAAALKDIPEVEMRGSAEVRHADDNFMTLSKAADDDAVKEHPAATASPPILEIDNYLETFQRVVLKVQTFCDTLRSLISWEALINEQQDEKGEQQISETGKLDVRGGASILTATSKEVQGRSSRLEGRKLKKLKKKIQKLLLPLLIAYKLKFLTLIPVLIGGLTLLVGTTGLAGFFFALFTAVMSLKTSTGAGHGSKAIVLKKI